jgi:hypothetical protein
MFLDTVDQFAKTAVAKSAFLRRSPLGFTSPGGLSLVHERTRHRLPSLASA